MSEGTKLKKPKTSKAKRKKNDTNTPKPSVPKKSKKSNKNANKRKHSDEHQELMADDVQLSEVKSPRPSVKKRKKVVKENEDIEEPNELLNVEILEDPSDYVDYANDKKDEEKKLNVFRRFVERKYDHFDFFTTVIDEICLEGLDGITLEGN